MTSPRGWCFLALLGEGLLGVPRPSGLQGSRGGGTSSICGQPPG